MSCWAGRGPRTTEPSARSRRSHLPAATGAVERAQRGRVGAGAGRAEQHPVRRQVGRAVLGDAARRGHLPVLDVDDAPAAASRRPVRRTPPPGHPPGTGAARAGRHRSGAGVVLGHHQAPRPDSRALLRPLRDPRHLLPLRRRFHRRRPRVSRDRRTAHRRHRHPARPTPQPARRPGHLDDVEAGRAASPRPRGRAVPLPPAHVERQPLLRSGVQDVEVRPGLPSRFGCLADARAFCQRFFAYYNDQHHHSRLGWHTPASVHDGTAEQIRAQRGRTLDAAYQANPTRFTRRPQPPRLPQAAWINQPSQEALIQTG